MAEPIRFAVIGGSGLYNMPDLTDTEELSVDTPFGPTSGAIVTGKLDGVPVAFLARHGQGHICSPTEVPYRANIFALKTLGVERVVSVSACGSLRQDYAPGHIVIPDQLYDHTQRRERTFFSDGLVTHVGVADPFCDELSPIVGEASRLGGASVHEGGTFITIEGPRFSTRGESETYRAWGMSIVGMTTSPEAFLAREAEMCYSVMAHVTDYDVWHTSEEPVSVDMVVRVVQENTQVAQRAIRLVVAQLERTERTCNCYHALADALITDRHRIPEETKARLKPLIEKYID